MKKTVRVLVLGVLLSWSLGRAAAQEASSTTAATEERTEATDTALTEGQDAAASSAEETETEQAAPEQASVSTTATPAPTEEAAPATTDQAAEATPEPPPPPKKFWRNSLFWFDQSLSTNTFSPGAQLTYNPTYQLSFTFMPRFYVHDRVFIRPRLDLNVEVTKSDFTTTVRQPTISDMFVDVVSPGLLRVGDFTLTAGGRLVLPTSLRSIANNMYLGAGGFFNASYSFPNVAHGLMFFVDGLFTGFFRGSNVAMSDTDYPCASLDNRPGRICSQASGFSAPIYQFSIGPAVNFSPIDHLNFLAIYRFWIQQGAPLADATLNTTGGPVALPGDNATHTRNFQLLYIAAMYDVTEWLNLALYYLSFTPAYNPNGSIRNPLWNPDTAVGLTATLTLDQLYKVLIGDETTLTPQQLQRIRNGQASTTPSYMAF